MTRVDPAYISFRTLTACGASAHRLNAVPFATEDEGETPFETQICGHPNQFRRFTAEAVPLL